MKLNLSPAAKGLYRHSYDPCFVGSLDTGELVPSIITPTVPTDHFESFEASGLVRIAPQIFPSYGKAYVRTAAFFVPGHQILESYDDFRQNCATYRGKSIVVPFFNSCDINYMFSTYVDLASSVASTTDPSAYFAANPSFTEDSFDFVYVSGGSGTCYYYFYKLTSLGRSFYKILKSLGYDFASFEYRPGNATSTTIINNANVKLNAFRFLAYMKVYNDMFLDGVFYNTSPLTKALKCIHDNADYTVNGTKFYNSATGQINTNLMYQFLFFALLPHDSNIYTQAWNSLNSPDGVGGNIQSPLNSASPSLLGPQIDSSTVRVEDTVNNNKLTQSSSVELSQNGLNLLKAFDSFVRRFNLSGSKAVQKVYSAFGIKSDDANSNFVHKLYDGSDQIKFYPVMSNSDTENSGGMTLGSYAGHGESGLNFSFNYKVSDYGFIVVLHWIQVKDIIVRGTHADNYKIKAFDFFTPEFDGKASRAIPMGEISVDKTSLNASASAKNDKDIYGFTNIYDELRELRDNVVGDFVLDANVRNFAFMRDFSKLRQPTAMTALKPQFADVHYWAHNGSVDMTNPFQMDQSAGDRFYLYLQYDIQAQRPIMSESASFDLGTGSVEVAKNGDIMR